MTTLTRLLPAFVSFRHISDDLFLRVLENRLAVGELSVTMPGGHRRVFKGHQPGIHAAITFHHWRAFRRLLVGGPVGFGESYMDGDWDTPNLADLLELGDINDRAMSNSFDCHPILNYVLALSHRFNDNSRAGSKRNIQAHYDLGNAFYGQWLDETMTYSSALFADASDTLAQAQLNKYRAIADSIELKPGMTVLEIGCGWGGFAELAAREYGASVVGLTLSTEQHAYAMERLAKANLSDKTDIRLQDYRDVTGQFDRIVSIEMIEAVGEKWWPTYFNTLRDRLLPGGKAGIQGIIIEESRFEAYRKGCDFIQRHIFPGGMLPTIAVMQHHAQAVGLSLKIPRQFGLDYEKTLAEWGVSFEKAWSTVEKLGFDQRFKRMWDFYIAYCRAGFRTKAIDVCHFVLEKS